MSTSFTHRARQQVADNNNIHIYYIKVYASFSYQELKYNWTQRLERESYIFIINFYIVSTTILLPFRIFNIYNIKVLQKTRVRQLYIWVHCYQPSYG